MKKGNGGSVLLVEEEVGKNKKEDMNRLTGGVRRMF
jgi:hypothetical protein